VSAVQLPEVELLPMSPRDLDAVIAIEDVVYPFPWTRGNFADSMKAGYNCWICRSGVDLVGYSVTMLAVDEAHLLNISVAAERQGHGFGARLLLHAMHDAEASGAKSLLLEVRPSNEKALILYKHFGFVQIGLRKGYYPAANGREDALVFRCAFDEVVA